SFGIFLAAAACEIAGCYAAWAYFRLGQSIWWLAPGAVALGLFAFLLTLTDANAAGRAFAAYGGVYILGSLAWLWAVEGVRPGLFDVVGVGLCLAGTAVILAGARAA